MKQTINGILLLDKDKNISSYQALRQIMHLFQARKGGHCGTLDPLATGLLPICFGEATKFVQYGLNADKTYLATLHFGLATSTGDQEGDIVGRADVKIDKKTLQQACKQFKGEIEQIPPMYSAIKHEGKPLYHYALQGIEIKRKKRIVRIHHIDILQMAFPFVSLKIICSKGTYIRTLAENLATSLGTFAHLSDLRRIATKHFTINQARTYQQLSSLTIQQRIATLLPCDVILADCQRIIFNEKQTNAIQQGKMVQFSANYEIITQLSLYHQAGHFIGIGEYLPKAKAIRALRLLSTT